MKSRIIQHYLEGMVDLNLVCTDTLIVIHCLQCTSPFAQLITCLCVSSFSIWTWNSWMPIFWNEHEWVRLCWRQWVVLMKLMHSWSQYIWNPLSWYTQTITSHVSSVFDGWTTKQRQLFLSFSIQYIYLPPEDQYNWSLKSNLLAFKHTIGCHTGMMLGKELETIIWEKGLEALVSCTFVQCILLIRLIFG